MVEGGGDGGWGGGMGVIGRENSEMTQAVKNSCFVLLRESRYFLIGAIQ